MHPPCTKVAIVGNRDWPNLEQVRQLVRSLPRDAMIVSGGAEGVDWAAIDEAKKLHMQYKEFAPKHQDYPGSLAMDIRNRQIARFCDVLYAFSWNGNNAGTIKTINYAKELGKEVIIVLNP